jgi:hypothetical protein
MGSCSTPKNERRPVRVAVQTPPTAHSRFQWFTITLQDVYSFCQVQNHSRGERRKQLRMNTMYQLTIV